MYTIKNVTIGNKFKARYDLFIVQELNPDRQCFKTLEGWEEFAVPENIYNKN